MDDVEPLVREETACCNITTGSGGCWPQRHRWSHSLQRGPKAPDLKGPSRIPRLISGGGGLSLTPGGSPALRVSPRQSEGLKPSRGAPQHPEGTPAFSFWDQMTLEVSSDPND